MARYKKYSYDQGQLIPVRFEKQILPGTFEHALSYIVDNELDLSVFEGRYKNDDSGAPAYDPAVLLKIVLYAYSRGIIHSRKIEQFCCDNVIFMALSANTRPHFTTIADFISSMKKEITPLFRDILLYCDEMGLIEKTMFAVDGCKLPSNASKEWSGTRADFEKKIEKLEKTIGYIMDKHKTEDENDTRGIPKEEEKKHVENIKKKISKLKSFLNDHDDKKGPKGTIRKSNITDNESAKMPSSHGVIQGYNGIAVSDSKHQVIVHAEAFGEGNESALLEQMIAGTRNNFKPDTNADVFKNAKLITDSGFHSGKNVELVENEKIDAYIPDNRFRKRDVRFAEAGRHRKPIDRKKKKYKAKYFRVEDFKYDEEKKKLICPAGKELYIKNRNFEVRGFKAIAYRAKITDCRSCKLRGKCLRNPNTSSRQVHIFYEHKQEKNFLLEKMKKKIDSAIGRYIYSKRMGIVEPVFANIRSNIGLNKFTLRGKDKVDTQWKLFTIVHNLGKIFRYGPGFA